MQHISTMATMFDTVVSRDQVLKDRVIEFVGLRTGIFLENKQVIIGQTLTILQHMTFAERTIINQNIDVSAMLEYINENGHDFSLQEVIVR